MKIEDSLGKSKICEKILRSLPDWFGIESAILDYVADVQKMDMWVALDSDIVGFISVNKHNFQTAEIHVMGLLQEYHGKKIGRQLIELVEKVLVEENFKFLTVKTLSEKRPDEYYDKTRSFYLKCGFIPLEESPSLWGANNPCLMLGKTLNGFQGPLLSHVEVLVSDYAKSIRFYDMILSPLGWKRIVCQKNHTVFSDGGTKFILCPAEEKYIQHGYHRKRIGLNHLAFYAQTKESLDSFFTTTLKGNGIECLYEAHPVGDKDYYAVFLKTQIELKLRWSMLQNIVFQIIGLIN